MENVKIYKVMGVKPICQCYLKNLNSIFQQLFATVCLKNKYPEH